MTCTHCQLPIDEGEILRAASQRTSHREYRCIDLLKTALAAMEARALKAEAEVERLEKLDRESERLCHEIAAKLGQAGAERDSLKARLEAAERALGNVYIMARRRKAATTKITAHDLAAWTHVIRFCEEVGCKSSILRDAAMSEKEPRA